jgi:hypothetical protein
LAATHESVLRLRKDSPNPLDPQDGMHIDAQQMDCRYNGMFSNS